MPAAAISSAACIPPTPPPATSAAPTDFGLEFSNDIGNRLRCRCLLRRSFPYRHEIQGQGSIDHVRPLPERHFDQQHGSGDDHVQRIGVMTAETDTAIA